MASTRTLERAQGWDGLSLGGRMLADTAPLAFRGGDTNLYRYVHNDPTDRTDPAGLSDKKSPDVRIVPPGTVVKPKGPSDIPPTLPGTWKVYIRASDDHAWICYVNTETGEKHTIGRYENGYGGVPDPAHPDPNDPQHWLVPPVAVPGVQMNQELLKEQGDPDKPKPGVATRPPITITDPKLYGGFGYNWRNNNCASYAKDVWQAYTGEYYNTGNPIWYSPGGLRGAIDYANNPPLDVTPGNGYYLP
jgi:hypothetical protein